jgi:uncharacterized protein (DUF1778 family)
MSLPCRCVWTQRSTSIVGRIGNRKTGHRRAAAIAGHDVADHAPVVEAAVQEAHKCLTLRQIRSAASLPPHVEAFLVKAQRTTAKV